MLKKPMTKYNCMLKRIFITKQIQFLLIIVGINSIVILVINEATLKFTQIYILKRVKISHKPNCLHLNVAF